MFGHAFVGWGLTTDTGWPQEFPQLIANYHPDLVIAMWSWDDSYAEAHPAAYRRLLQRAIGTLTAPGDGVAGVMLLQFPPMGGGGPDPARQAAQRAVQVAAWTKIAEQLPAAEPGRVLYLPLAHSIAPGGHYTAWLPPADDLRAPRSRWIRVRMADNVHFCPAGASRYAAALLADLTDLYHLHAPAPGWSTGTWTSNISYRETPGACPDDHPPA